MNAELRCRVLVAFESGSVEERASALALIRHLSIHDKKMNQRNA